MKINNLLEDMNIDLNRLVPIKDEVIITCTFNKRKISQLEYEINSRKVILEVTSYNNNEKINVPNIDNCIYVSEEELINHIHKGISGDLNKYTLIIDNPFVNTKTNEKINKEFTGCIYDTLSKNNVKMISSNDIRYDEVSYSEGGIYKFKVYTKYLNKEFSTYVYVNVKGDIEISSNSKINNLDDITYGFNYENNVYLCDDKYIYKFDFECNKLLGKIDLKCAGNSYYVKDEYMYVAGNYPYNSTYNDEYSYEGTVTKIKIEDFTIAKQVNVNSLPNSIIVDNRDNVIISKKANQHVNNEIVNVDTGKLSPAFDGYENDVLVYDPTRDYITNITNGHSGDNELYEFKNGQWVEGSKASISGSKVYSQNRGMIITSTGVYKNDTFSENYIYLKVESENFRDFYYTYYNISDGEKLYSIKSKYDNGQYYLITYNFETKEYFEEPLPKEYKDKIICAYLYSGYLFIINETGSIMKIKIN